MTVYSSIFDRAGSHSNSTLPVTANMNPEVAERTQKVIAKHLRVTVDKVPIDATFEQLGMDSLDSVNLLFEVEDEFDISIDDQEAKSITSVQQMIDGIEVLLARKAAGSDPVSPSA